MTTPGHFITQVNANTLLDFFSQLNKPASKSVQQAAAAAAAAAAAHAAAATASVSQQQQQQNVAAAVNLAATTSAAVNAAAAAAAVKVKEEPLSEDDLRALQKDRQKKDNHNMSELTGIVYATPCAGKQAALTSVCTPTCKVHICPTHGVSISFALIRLECLQSRDDDASTSTIA